MNSFFPHLTSGTRFTDPDRELVIGCVERHIASLPDSARTMLARPNMEAVFDHLACLVPREMWDGIPNVAGMVRWKPITFPVGFPTRVIAPEFQHHSPSTLAAYLQSVRMCRFSMNVGDRVVVMPATPDHNPGQDIRRLLSKDLWGPLLRLTGYLPFATSDDDTLYCADTRHPTAERDAPVITFATDVVFRLLPRLIGHTDPRAEVEQIATPAFVSIANMLSTGSATTVDRSPHARQPISRASMFDWSEWLTEEPLEHQKGPKSAFDDPDPASYTDHLDRIADKLAHLRSGDPAFIIPGAEVHRHIPNPVLSPDNRENLERLAGVSLPSAYGAYLGRIGNGGFGPWTGLSRVEADFLNGVELRQLSEPFPHCAKWNPRLPKNATEADMVDYLSSRHVTGTVRLGYLLGEDGQFLTALLVVAGPERGHIWYDDRRRMNGIRPIVRRGPFSFLAWQEEGIDSYLDRLDGFYARIAAEYE